MAGGVEALVRAGRSHLEAGDSILAAHLAEWATRAACKRPQTPQELKRDAYEARLREEPSLMGQGIYRAARNDAAGQRSKTPNDGRRNDPAPQILVQEISVMKVKAAICWEPKQDLEIEEVDLEGPRNGECLIRLTATGVCHTDAYTMSGKDPSGLFPTVLGHEGGGIVQEVGPGVNGLAVGDHVIPLYIPECRNCKILQQSQDQPMRRPARDAGPGIDAGRHEPTVAQGKAHPSLYGDVHLCRVHGRP